MNKFIPRFTPLVKTTKILKANSLTVTCLNLFSQGKPQKLTDVLKTYLEIIPPHEIHQIVEGKQKKLDNLIKNAQKINGIIESQANENSDQFKSSAVSENKAIEKVENLQEQEQRVFKQLYKYIKKQSPYVPTSTLSKIVEVVSFKNPKLTPESKDVEDLKRKTYLKIVREIKYKSESLPLEEVIDFIYKLAKLNIKQYDLMKAAENVIIQETIKINFPVIRKILWSFTHLDVGSSVLYSHISKTIRVGQHQLDPLELAESAYMLSKVSENSKGGYGVYQIAEKQIELNLSRMTFHQLVKASSFLLTQNIGTNQFQLKLEAEIYKKYPTKDKLNLTDFILLLKATSAYYFKFNDKSLFNILKTSTVRQAKNTSMEQFQDLIWSWGRLGKGDQELWDCLQSEIKRRIQFLKPRQIAFFYHAISSSSHADQQVLGLLQNKFLAVPAQKINEHYYIKMLLGMQKQKKFNDEIFLTISQAICSKINNLSKNQLIAFFKVLNESDYDYTNKEAIQPIIEALNEVGSSKLMKTIYTLKLSEITEMIFTYIKLDINNPELIKQCFASLNDIMNIPKHSFAKALFSFTIKDNYEKAYKMVIILEQLLHYGPIGYFFSPYEFPLMAYCICHLHYNSKGALQVDPQLLGQVKATLKQINPVILNDFVKKAYDEAFNIIQQYNKQAKKGTKKDRVKVEN